MKNLNVQLKLKFMCKDQSFSSREKGTMQNRMSIKEQFKKGKMQNKNKNYITHRNIVKSSYQVCAKPNKRR